MKAKNPLALWLQTRPSNVKVAIIAIFDFAALNVAVLLAYALRISSFDFPNGERLPLYLVAPLLSIGSAFPFGIYWSVSRSYSSILEKRIIASQVVAAGFWITIIFIVGTAGFARSVVVIYVLLGVAAMILLRKAVAFVLGSAPAVVRHREPVPALIYGAGREGLLVLEAMRQHRVYRPIAFVDTDYTLVGRMISGLRVYTPEDLPRLMTRHRPREVIVARSDLGRSSRRMLVDHLLDMGLMVKTVPDPGEFIEGHLKLSELRPIKVEDLLGRDPVPPDRVLMERVVKDQVVMVTGAGGSIGSELVRQAFAYGPRKLVLADNNEFALFEIHRVIENAKSSSELVCELVPILADVRDKATMSAIMASHKVDIVFHAAAYKHVRMVQENAAAGIHNNVFGTRAVAEAALENKVKRFILISTDKAVRPMSIMGATKRVAEMVVQALAAEQYQGTIFAMVRFGNVLGSTGSVVPLFREQIAVGGPVLVTHPDVTRYFMLIPEAAQLVIQAAAMAEGGEVFVLDMGDPVKILQLAESMIELAGLTRKNEANPDGDVEIKFTGLKDGEKLFEELQIGTHVSSTSHPRIMMSRERFMEKLELDSKLECFSKEESVTKVSNLFAIVTSRA